MKIMGMGVHWNGSRLFPAMEESALAKSLVEAIERNVETARTLAKTTSEGVSFRGEVIREAFDPGDPRKAGWTFLINQKDPRRKEMEKILEPLALHRGMADLKAPLTYRDEPFDEWFDWLNDNYYSLKLKGKKVPHYVLIIGGPDQVPFRFQSVLDTVASVGRVDFDSVDDLKKYVEKVIRLENAPAPPVTRNVIVFAPDAGLPDPTYFSLKYMAKPLADHIHEELKLTPQPILGKEATKKNLLAALQTGRPALLYTASHGLGALQEPLEVQKRYNGAVCCQHTGPLTLDALFAAEDVPPDRPFLEGGVFFQFACFGYGTPAESDYAHWLEGAPQKYTDKDFVAALPKRLLAHPRGPIAFIGHLDTAFLHGFTDAEDPHILERWHPRIEPFVDAVNQLLRVQPSGLAMQDMNNRYSVCNALITNTYDRQKRGKLKWDAALEARFLDNWITRGDAQNYMIFGDPAVRLRIPEKP
jgi:hypothetical protein